MIEALGTVAGVIILVSLLMRSISTLRLINLVGAVLFAIYGLGIQAWPVLFLNTGIVIVNVYYLSRLWFTKDFFDFVSFAPNDALALTFLKHQKEDIERFMPLRNRVFDEADMRFFILRNTQMVGLFVAQKEAENTWRITLDYVIQAYRDGLNGQKMFAHATHLWHDQNVDVITSTATTKAHQNYLKKLGFKAVGPQEYVYTWEG